MKKLLALFTLVICLNSLKAQETLDITISGIDAKTEKNMLPGDVISYWTAENGDGHQNVRVRIIGKDGKDVFFSSMDAAADANRHYTINHKVSVTDGDKFSFDEELEVLVYVETIFGNVLWAEETRTRSNITDPFVLNKYTKWQNKTTPAMRRFVITYYYKGNKNGIEEKVAESEDGWDNRKISDFRFKLKNVGDTEWKVDTIFETGQNLKSKYVRVNIPFEGISPIQLNKKVIVRSEVTTEKGNIVWHETECDPRELRTLFIATEYSIIDQDQSRPTSTSDSSGTGDKDDNTVKADNNKGDNSNTQTIKPSNSTNTANNTSKPPTTAVTPVISGATDLTTQTLKAECSSKTSGDTTLLLNGSSVCLKQLKPEGSKKTAALLGVDCNFKIGDVVFPFKGNERISYLNGTGKIVEGVLRADVSYASNAGTILLKEGTLVAFNGDQLIAGSLSEAATLKINGIDVACATNSSLPFDIRFDNQGRLQECTIGAEMKWTNGIDLAFPANSRLVYKGDNLYRVISETNSSFELNGKTIQVKGDLVSAAYEFNSKNELEYVNSGPGNSIDIEGQSIALEDGKEIKLTLAEGTYSIEKFYVATEVKVNVYKKDKQKEVIVKAGKKIVLSEGKVVKAG